MIAVHIPPPAQKESPTFTGLFIGQSSDFASLATLAAGQNFAVGGDDVCVVVGGAADLGKTLDKTSCSTQTDSKFHDPTPFDQGARYEARLLTFQGKTIQISMPGGRLFIRPPEFFSGEKGDKVLNHELGMSITFVGTFNRIFGLSILTAGRGREGGPDSLLRGSYGFGRHVARSMKTV